MHLQHIKRVDSSTVVAAIDRKYLGMAAMVLTVMIWAGFALSTRAASGSTLTFVDVAFIRAFTPTVFLICFLPSRIAMIRRAGIGRCAIISSGAGIPFFWCAVMGGGQTSAAHVGALIAGTAPIFMTVLAWVLFQHIPSKKKVYALLLILVGALLTLFAQEESAQNSVMGIGLLLSASLLWAGYSLAIKGSGLDPIACTLVVAMPSSLCLAGLGILDIMPSNWEHFSVSEALPFILVQGVGAGIVASLFYSFAISLIGPSQCGAIGAMAPVLAALLAIPVLGESLTAMMVVAVGAICTGVYCFSRG